VVLFSFMMSRSERAGAMSGQVAAREASQPVATPGLPVATVAHVMTHPGSLIFLRGQASFIQDRGFVIHAITSPGPELASFREKEGAVIHAVPMSRSITPLQDLVSLWQLCRVLRGVRPRIVHAHTPKGGLLGMLAAWICRTPIRIYHLRGLRYDTTSGLKRRILRQAERVTCMLAQRVISVSHSLRDMVVGEGVCPADKIKVLAHGSGNGVDAMGRFKPLGESARAETRARHHIAPDALVIGFVGRFVADKGVAELASAWKELRASEPRLHLMLAGDLDEAHPIPVEVMEALRSDPRVHFTGFDPNMPLLYAAMDVVALPTYREGFPNVALEAAAMALPVVATSVLGCLDAVQDGVTGTLIPARDPMALAGALRRYLADPELRATHGAAARRRVLADFRREVIWEAIVAEYRELLARR
jgi:glycosyltransferase involved in cell wall biosynthesis